jgi:tryptophanyl-tRNA synthetase
VHQAADILFCTANLVPVGKDQLPHLEQARVIARRFDAVYGRGVPERPVFLEPEALLSENSNILGTDGQKMSKSRANAIELGMTADETARLLKRAVTDAERLITYERTRRPEVANLLSLLTLCTGKSPDSLAESIGDGGGARLKSQLTEALNEALAPIRARRSALLADHGYLWSVLKAGNQRANEIADATLAEVRSAMHMDYNAR